MDIPDRLGSPSSESSLEGRVTPGPTARGMVIPGILGTSRSRTSAGSRPQDLEGSPLSRGSGGRRLAIRRPGEVACNPPGVGGDPSASGGLPAGMSISGGAGKPFGNQAGMALS